MVLLLEAVAAYAIRRVAKRDGSSANWRAKAPRATSEDSRDWKVPSAPESREPKTSNGFAH